MDTDRWQRIKELFEAARDLAPGERRAFVEAKAGDDRVATEVLSLLEHDSAGPTAIDAPALGHGFEIAPQSPDAAPDTLDPPSSSAALASRGASPPPAPPPPPLDLGGRIGPYELIRIIGRGGMGLVYEAQQKRPHRLVALKIVQAAGRLTDEQRHRFRREAESLGRLRHPGIATIYEAGETPAGHHYVAMELVRGSELLAHTRPLERRERLDLFAKICEAVHYAHQRGVIHRDLKPSNILVDESGQPRILDFGLARINDDQPSAHTVVTEVGQIMGTLPYMSPEQVSGQPYDVDTRSDVYALGVILHQMLVDALPYELEGESLPETARIIAEAAPRRLGAIDPTLRGDLETIVLKTLEKEPDQRYESAAALGDDVRRFLDDQPILARPPSTIYQLRKLVRRHTVPFALAAALFVLAVAFGVVGTVQALKLGSAMEQVAVESDGRAHQLYASQIARAQLLLENGNITLMREVLAACADDRRGWEWYWLIKCADPSAVTVRFEDSPVLAAAVTGDRITALVADGEQLVARDLVTKEKLFDIDSMGAEGSAVAFDPAGMRILVGTREGTVRVVNASDGALERTIDVGRGALYSVRFLPDGRRVLANSGGPAVPMNDPRRAAGTNSSYSLFDVGTGEILGSVQGKGFALAADASPDGKYVAYGTLDGLAELWSLETGERVWSARQPHLVASVAFTPDGKRLLVCIGHGNVRVLSVPDGREIEVLRGHERSVRSIAMSPDGKRVACGDGAGVLKVWDLERYESLMSVPAHQASGWGVGFAPNGEWLITTSYGGSVKLWSTGERTIPGGPIEIEAASVFDFAPGKPEAVRRASEHELEWLDLVSGERRVVDAGFEVSAVAFGPEGRFVAVGGKAGEVGVWDTRGDEVVVWTRGGDGAGADTAAGIVGLPAGALRAMVITRGASMVIAMDAAGRMRAVGPDGVERWGRGDLDARSVAIDGTESVLAVGAEAGGVHLLNANNGTKRRTLMGHQGAVTTVAWPAVTLGDPRNSPEPRNPATLVTGSDDSTIRLWDAELGECRQTLTRERPAIDVQWLDASQRLGASGLDGSIQVSHPRGGEELISMIWIGRVVTHVATGDSARLLTARSAAGEMRIWDANMQIDVDTTVRLVVVREPGPPSRRTDGR